MSSEYHAVIFPEDVGITTDDYLHPDEFVCPGCNYVAHEVRRRANGECDECNDDKGGLD